MSKGYIDVSEYDDPWDEDTRTEIARSGLLNGIKGLSNESGLLAGINLGDSEQPYFMSTGSDFKLSFQEQEGLWFDKNEDTGIYSSQDDELIFMIGGVVAAVLNTESLAIFDDAGVAKKWINRTCAAYGYMADIHGDSILSFSATASIGVFIDSDNDTDIGGEFQIFADSESWIDGKAIFYVREDTRMGMRINNVDHDATDIVRATDTFFEVVYDTEDTLKPGGAIIRGLKDSGITSGEEGGALQLRGLLEADVEIGKNTTARSLVEVYGAQLSGGSLANVRTSGNVFSVRARVGGAWINCMIVDADGDIHYRGGLAEFDEEDDSMAISDLYHLLTGNPGSIIRYTRERLVQMGVIGDDEEELFIGRKGFTALLFGSIRQVRNRQDQLIEAANVARDRIAELEQRVDTLEIA